MITFLVIYIATIIILAINLYREIKKPINNLEE